MRNIAAEKKLVENIFLYSGILFIVGILVIAVGAEVWLVLNYDQLGLAIFLMLQGTWFLGLSLLFGFVGSTVARERQQQ